MDDRLIHADSTRLAELKSMMRSQADAPYMAPVDMEEIIICSGAIENICEAVRRLSDGKRVLMVSGPVLITDKAGADIKRKIKGLLDEAFETEWLILSEKNDIVHATPENAEIIGAKLKEADCVIGVGGGTICDLCKYATSIGDPPAPIPLVMVQTALSVNAFSDNSSVMLINGVKRTLHSRYPQILIIDLDIVSAAPAEMNASGFGDLTATWTAPIDWYLGYRLGMSDHYLSSPSDMIRSQCDELLRDASRLPAGDEEYIRKLANVLTLSGLCMGFANESSPASGSEHVISHMIDMSSLSQKKGLCYHGSQVAVAAVYSSLIWDYVLHEFDPAAVDVDACFPAPEKMEPRVLSAFSWLDENGAAAAECWKDYRTKIGRWNENRARLEAFLSGFASFRKEVLPMTRKPEMLVNSMREAGVPCRFSLLNYPVDKKTAVWAITNCHLMRKRFSVIDFLHYCGIWNEPFIQKILERAEALDAGL